jgi:uncharacterized membrane protein YphA (DoxX/SURF4 family)
LFIWSGIGKLFLPYDPSVFKANSLESDPSFFAFYDVLHQAGYLYFVGFCQLLCGLLLVFRRTYLLGSVMMVPLMLCLLMTHVFFSKNTFYLVFDSTILVFVLILIGRNFSGLKTVFLKRQPTLI